jgi:hypothetical protein
VQERQIRQVLARHASANPRPLICQTGSSLASLDTANSHPLRPSGTLQLTKRPGKAIGRGALGQAFAPIAQIASARRIPLCCWRGLEEASGRLKLPPP